MASSFEQAGAWLAGADQQQTDLQRAVAAGELWMEAGVAERAAARCDQAIEEIETVAVAPSFSRDPPEIDSCAEALRIAQMIEPRLPKAGS